MTTSKVQGQVFGDDSNVPIPSSTESIPVKIPVYSPNTDTVRSLIDRVEKAVLSEEPLTNENLKEIELYLDLASKYAELRALERENDKLIQARSSSASQPKAAQNPVVPSEAPSKVHTPELSSAEPSSIGSKPKEDIPQFDEQSIKTQSLQFSQISQTDLQAQLDWMSDDSAAQDNKPKTDNDSSSGLISRVNRGFWNTVSYFTTAKK